MTKALDPKTLDPKTLDPKAARNRVTKSATSGGDAAADSTPGSNVDEPIPSYEQARDELADVVRALETGGVTLEESLALWERGEQLARICEQWLEGARARLQAVVDPAPDGG